jgi:hypothetical protein
MTLYGFKFLFFPTIIDEVGTYITRCGEEVQIDYFLNHEGWGAYSNNVKEHWHISGRVWPHKECDNDIVRKK